MRALHERARSLSSTQRSLQLFLDMLLLHSKLSSAEQKIVLDLPGKPARIRNRVDIVSPGEVVDHACLVASGLVARFDQMRNGHRQTTALHIPGEMCDLHSVVQPKASWSITALTDASVVFVPHKFLWDAALRNPNLAVAFWRDGMAQSAILGKWVGNLGRKNATARVAHLICEMGLRNEAAGLGTRSNFDLPMTQEQLADAVGVTPVHVNRTLQVLRKDAGLTFKRPRVGVEDWTHLAELAEFDPDFLQLRTGGLT
jgi:CRP-like cAMP-binding protein